MKLEHPLIGMLIQTCVFFKLLQKIPYFFSVPSHIGIKGNERADSTHAKVDAPYNDFKHRIYRYILSTWQDNWNGAVANKLCSVIPVLGDWQSCYMWCKQDEDVNLHTGGAGRMRMSCVLPASVIRIRLIHIS